MPKKFLIDFNYASYLQLVELNNFIYIFNFSNLILNFVKVRNSKVPGSNPVLYNFGQYNKLFFFTIIQYYLSFLLMIVLIAQLLVAK